MMRSLTFAALAVLGIAGQTAAQDNPLSTEVRQSWTRTWGNVVAAAEKMPEEHYGFKPAPESQSFKDLVAHTADSAMGSCSGLTGERKTAGAREMTTKAELIGALKAVGAECEKAYGSLTRRDGGADDHGAARPAQPAGRRLRQHHPHRARVRADGRPLPPEGPGAPVE